jgi:hypothetical protein
MHYKKRVDKNQTQIVDLAKKLGYYVAHTYAVGSGFPDLVLGKKGLNILIEIKDGYKKQLTPSQKIFHTEYLGAVYVIHSIDEFICLDKKLFGK